MDKSKLSILILLLILFVNINRSYELSDYRLIRAITGSHFEPFIDDFSRLARITNAISLQDLILQSNVSFREFGSELLGTRTKEFTTLINTDVTFIKKTIQETFADTNTVNAMEIDQMDEKLSALQFLTDCMLKEETYKKARNADMAGIVAIVSTINGNDTWKTCMKKQEVIISALNVLEKTATVSQKEKIHDIESFQRVGDISARCLAEATPFLDVTENEFIPEILALNQTHQLTGFIDDFKMKYPILNTMPDFFGVLKDEFSKTASFRQLLISKQATHLDKVISAHFEGMDHAAHEVPIYTSGLPNGYSDLMKIKDDINSEWFLKNVAYGNKTNVKIVEKGLEASEQFIEAMKPLGNSWEKFSSHDIKPFATFVEDWQKAEDFAMVPGVEESIDKSSDTIQKCLASASSQLYFDFSDFHKTYQKLSGIAEIIKKVTDNLKEMQAKVDSVKLDLFFEKLKSVNITKNLEADIKSIKSLRNYHIFHQYAVFVNATAGLEKELQAAVVAFGPTSTFQDVPKILDDSKLLDVLSCLKTNQFDNQTKSMEFMERAHNLTTNSVVIQGMVEYLDELGTVQGEEKPVEKVFDLMRKSTGPVLNLPNREYKVIGAGIRMLRKMSETLGNRRLFEELMAFNTTVNWKIIQLASGSGDSTITNAFMNPQSTFGTLLDDLEKLSVTAATSDGSLSSMAWVLEKALEIPGLNWRKNALKRVANGLKKEFPAESAKVSELAKLNLDFAKNNLYAPGSALDAVKGFFDEIFGRIPVRIRTVTTTEDSSFSNWAIMGVCIGILLLCILAALIGFRFSIRKTYRSWRLYQNQNLQEFEKLWRYSLFMDTADGQNALISAADIGSCYSARRLIENGAYINAYSNSGNTALHIAVKQGNLELAKLLIENGADRTALNAENLKPEELKSSEQIQNLFAKNRNKKFKIRVPEEFPTDKFVIFIDKEVDASVRSLFERKFSHLTMTSHPIPGTTHCICKTSDSGILETDDVELLAQIFLGTIMVREDWMADCVKDDKVIKRDDKHLIEHVKYNGILYGNCVLPWSEAQAKRHMPYLCGAHVAFVMAEFLRISTWAMIITTLGGSVLGHLPISQHYNPGAHPYLHSSLGPVFTIHDGSTDMKAYQNDKIFTVMTEEEFLVFLLKKELNRNCEKVVVPLMRTD